MASRLMFCPSALSVRIFENSCSRSRSSGENRSSQVASMIRWKSCPANELGLFVGTTSVHLDQPIERQCASILDPLKLVDIWNYLRILFPNLLSCNTTCTASRALASGPSRNIVTRLSPENKSADSKTGIACSKSDSLRMISTF